MQAPMISIIIPVYNSQDFLGECYQSLAKQTFQDFEIIFIDDGSTDNSLNIIWEIEHIDKKVKVLTQKNCYAGVARNNGLAVAKGKYVLFLDADDFFVNVMLEKIVEQAERLNSDIVVFDGYLYDNKTKKALEPTWILEQKYITYIPNNEVFSAEEYSRYIFNFTAASSWNKLYNRKFVNSYKMQFQNTQRVNDLFFTYAALSHAERISILNERLLYYRIGNPVSLQSTREESIYDFYKALLKLKTYLQSNNLFNRYEQSFLNLSLFRCIRVLSLIQERDIQEGLFNRLKEDIFWALGIMPMREKEYYYFDNYSEFHKIMFNEYDDYVSLTKPYYKELKSLICENTSIIIYGAGLLANKLINEFNLDKMQDKSIIIVVTDKKGNPNSIKGIDVYDITALEEYNKNSLIIIAANKGYQDEIKRNLISRQYEKIYYFG